MRFAGCLPKSYFDVRSLALLLAFSSVSALSQAMPPTQNVYMHNDGRCAEARPGDTVHYSLMIQGVDDARAIYADLQMRMGRQLPFRPSSGLPLPDLRSMGGGGMSKADPTGQGAYEFSFVVPKEIYGGVYRGTGVTVSTGATAPASAPASFMDVTRRAQKQVRDFCLNVAGGTGAPAAKPEVTGFQAGQIVPK